MNTQQIINEKQSMYINGQDAALKKIAAPESAVTAKPEEKDVDREELQASVFGDVLGVSKDGDTVTAQKEAVESATDGLVYKREASVKESEPLKSTDRIHVAHKEIDDEKQISAQEVKSDLLKATGDVKKAMSVMKADTSVNVEKLTSTASETAANVKDEAIDKARKELIDVYGQDVEGKILPGPEKEDIGNKFLKDKSASQIQTLFEKGKISKNAYDREVERREQLTGENAYETPDSVKKMREKEIPNVEREVKKEMAPDAEQSREKQIEEIHGKQEKNAMFSEKMGALAEKEENVSIKGEALEKALENDRADIVAQIFNRN